MKFVKLESVNTDIDYGLTESATDKNTGHKFLRITDIREGSINWNEVPFCECSESDSKKYELHDGDVVFARTGSVGNTGLINNAPKGSVFASYLIRIRPNQKFLDPFFLSYFFQTPNYWGQIEAGAVGAIQGGVNASKLKELDIPLPPLPEQRRIAGLLSRTDRLRRLHRVGDSLSASLLQSVFLEMFGDYLNKIEILFGDVLEIPLTNGFFEKNEKYGEGNPIVWVDNLYHTNIIDTTFLRRVRVSQKQLEKYEVLEGDLLFTRSSLVEEGVGQANIIPELKERTMFESHVIRARVDNKKINPLYALGLFRSQFGKSEIMKRAKTATMTTIGQDTLYEFPCPIPPLNLQEEFAGIVTRVEKLRVRQAESARQSELLFQSLLSNAFTEGSYEKQ